MGDITVTLGTPSPINVQPSTPAPGFTVQATGLAAAVNRKIDVFVATDGQADFTLSSVPPNVLGIDLSVNGQVFDVMSGAFTVNGTAIHWLGLFRIQPNDTVTIRY
jgi:hypothetical protein